MQYININIILTVIKAIMQLKIFPALNLHSVIRCRDTNVKNYKQTNYKPYNTEQKVSVKFNLKIFQHV